MGLFGDIGGIAGGIIGGIANNSDEEAAAASRAKALEVLENLQLPDLDDPVAIEKYVQAGILSPELVQAIPMYMDQKNEIQENAANRANQQYALNALKQLSQTGMSAQDLAQFANMREQVAADTNAKTQDILRGAQERGQLGGGDQLAAQLASAQGADQAAAKQARDLAAQAAQARQGALAQFSNLAGQVRTQDYNTLAQNVENEKLRRTFLDQNAIARQNANVAAKNQSNLYNLQRQQGTSDTNISAANNELYRQVNAKQQMFNNALNKAKALSGQYSTNANAYDKAATATAQGWTNLGQGAGSLANNLFGKKEDEDEDIWSGFNFSEGGEVPGDAEHEGNDKRNDIIDARLSPQEIVLPRTVTMAKDAPERAKEFVKNVKKKDEPKEDILAELLELNRRIKALEKSRE